MTRDALSAAADGDRPADPGGVDVGAVLAAMQDQIDDLTATVEAQQRVLDELVRERRSHRSPRAWRPDTGRNGIGER